MNDALRQAEAVDPQWARSEQRKLWLLKGITAAVMLALAVGTVSFILGIHNSTEITHVEKTVEKTVENSACQEDAAGAECQKAKTESAEAANIHVSCIPFEKVAKPGFLKRTKCNEAGTPTAAASPSGGDASTNPTVHSLPAPGNGGLGESSTPQPSGGGGSTEKQRGNGGREPSGEPAAEPPAPTSSTSSQQSSSSTTERVESSVEETSPEAVGPVRSAVGGVVEGLSPTLEEAGESVDGTVEGVTGTTCSLAKVLCP